MIRHQIRGRWTGAVKFEAEIDCDENASIGIKVGLAVKWARKTGAYLIGAYLIGAYLIGAYLIGADLSEANLSGVPVIPNIHQAVYEAAAEPGALDMSKWHVCDTTHCRAGWVTTLAGAAGKALEDRIGTPAAATLIYLASDPALERVPDFYTTNERAMADMKRLAEAEAARAEGAA